MMLQLFPLKLNGTSKNKNFGPTLAVENINPPLPLNKKELLKFLMKILNSDTTLFTLVLFSTETKMKSMETLVISLTFLSEEKLLMKLTRLCSNSQQNILLMEFKTPENSKFTTDL